jgi:hypothetical protein
MILILWPVVRYWPFRGKLGSRDQAMEPELKVDCKGGATTDVRGHAVLQQNSLWDIEI